MVLEPKNINDAHNSVAEVKCAIKSVVAALDELGLALEKANEIKALSLNWNVGQQPDLEDIFYQLNLKSASISYIIS